MCGEPTELTFSASISGVRTDTALTLAAFCESSAWSVSVVAPRADGSSTGILYYDYALTVVAEIEYYWSPPSLSLSFVLFAVSRYVGLLGPIPVFFEYFEVFSQYVSSAPRVETFRANCHGGQRCSKKWYAISHRPVCTISGLRA